MSDIAWATEHSVETTATPAFTWTYMTDVKNWDDPPAEFRLNGSFTSGSLGTTKIPGQVPRQWRLREVKPHDSYTKRSLWKEQLFYASGCSRSLLTVKLD